MNQCRSLVPRGSFGQDGMDLFVKCNLSFQKIGFVLEKWQESARNIRHSLIRREIMSAEACLREAEQRIWQLFMRQMNPGGINGGNGSSMDDMRHRSPMPRNQYGEPETIGEHVVQVHKKQISVSLTKCDGVPTTQQQLPLQQSPLPAIMTAQAAPATTLENLLVDWFVSLDDNDQLRLEGMLLNEGHWKTSPIAVRVGPTTVKTHSGTVYNMSGGMFSPDDEDIPIFVQEKFANGFPPDWEEVVQKWGELIAMQKREVIQETVMALTKSPPVPGPPQSKPVAYNTQMRTYEKDIMPPPNVGQMKVNSTQHQATDRYQTIPKEVERTVKRDVQGLDLPKQRFSKRVLNKTLEELSMNGTLNKTQDVTADIMLIKKWFVEMDSVTGDLVLLGSLINDKGVLLERNFLSERILRRLKCDLIETIDGEIYRLLGPAAVRSKVLEHGFPFNWKELMKKGMFPVRVVEQKLRRSTSNAGGTSDAKLNTTRSSSAGAHRKSSMIQHVIRQRINQGHTSLSDSRANRTKDKNSTMRSKRMLDMQGFSSNDVVPLKKKRSNESIKADEGTKRKASTRDRSQFQDISVTSDEDFKKALLAGWTKQRPVVVDITVDDSPEKEKNTTSKAASKKEKPQPSTSNKYLPGMLSENGCSDFDFNIF